MLMCSMLHLTSSTLALLALVEDLSFFDDDLRTRRPFSLREDFFTTPPPVMAGGAVRLEPATIPAGAEAGLPSMFSSFSSSKQNVNKIMEEEKETYWD